MPESKVVVYNRLEEELRMQIKSGFLQDRTRLRSENAFAARYGISRSSVRKALATLEKEGLIRRSRGCGTFVTRENLFRTPKQKALPGKNILYLSFSSLYSREVFSQPATFYAVYDGFRKVLPGTGYEFQAAHVGIDWQVPAELSAPSIAGIVFEGSVRKDFFDRYMASKPCIGVNCYDPALNCSWVLEDARGIAELSIRHLFSLGYRKIALLADECSSHPVKELYLGYCAGLIQHGLPIRPEYVMLWDRELKDGELSNTPLENKNYVFHLQKLFSSHDKPDAIICQDHFRAEEARIALESFGLEVPEDVGMICRKYLPTPQDFSLEYDGFDSRKKDVFTEAAKQLLEEIKGHSAVEKRITYISPQFIPGHTLSKRD